MSKRIAGYLPMLCLLVLVPQVLLAATTPGIEIDGNYEDDDDVDPLEDWFPNHEPFEDPVSQEDDTLCGTSPSPKNDITKAYAANNSEFLYMAMERRANTGQTSFFWKFDIGKDGPDKGDFIFAFCFGSQDRVTDTFVLEYDEATGTFIQDNTPPTIDFAVNSERVFAPFGALDRHGNDRPFIESGKFAEASIDLDDIEGFDICKAVAATLEIETKSSCSLNSQCKDTTGELDFSFFPLAADLALEQPDLCEPVLMAHANAQDGTPPFAYRWFLNGAEITDDDPTYATSDTIVIPLDPDVCDDTEVAVIVEDTHCSVEDSDIIDVNQKPVAQFAEARVGDCDLTLTYDGTASTDCNVGDTLSYLWDFDGDGRPDSSEPAGTHVYPVCGERTIGFIALDEAACPSDAAQMRVYANQPPMAGLRLQGGDCLNLLFADTTVDCDLTQNSDLYTESLDTLIDFGDGTNTTENLGTHEYPTCGSYPVNLTSTDAKGCTDSVDRSVTIETVFQID